MAGPASTSRDSSLDHDAIRRQLKQILTSPGFGSERRGRLLTYLVENALAGQAVKEYAIGVDVFEKPVDYDPRIDPSVRVEIGRLRAKLRDYYSRAGDRAPVRIEIPKGSYAPVFGPPVKEDHPEQAPAVPSKGRNFTPVAIAACVVVLAAIGAGAWRYFSRGAAINSVVVLPFANLTGDAHNDYLADGVTEQLTDALAQTPTLRVVARTSAFQFKGKNADIREIGKKVDADAVIEGSLATVDGRLRLTVQVNRTRDGYHVFSRAFDGGPRELARLEEEMAAPVLATLQPQAVMARRTAPDPEAYDLLLKARAFRGDGTRTASDQAITYLQQAIERDPGYADAYAALAGVYAADATTITSEPVEYANLAKAAAGRALELNPDLGVAYSVLGFMDSLVLLDWKKGEQELRKSTAMLPQNAAAHNRLGAILEAQGRFPEAIAEMEQSVKLDPLAAAPRVSVGLAYFMSRNYDEALRRFLQVRDLHPELVAVHCFIGSAWEGEGQFDHAMEEYKIVERQLPEASWVFVAHLLAATGKHTEALALLRKMEHPGDGLPNAFDIAAVYAALGQKDAAFEWLDRAYQRRIIWFLKVHPFLDPLRGDPRFTALLKKTGLA